MLTPHTSEVMIPTNVATDNNASNRASFPLAFNGSELTDLPTFTK